MGMVAAPRHAQNCNTDRGPLKVNRCKNSLRRSRDEYSRSARDEKEAYPRDEHIHQRAIGPYMYILHSPLSFDYS